MTIKTRSLAFAFALTVALATSASATDTTPPTASITSPASSSYLTTLTSIWGTASDNAGGTGFGQAPARVIITISRHLDGAWWDGYGWGYNIVHLTTTLSNNTGLSCDWVRNYGLPNPWEESKYTIYAKAYDAAGNGSAADSHGVWVPAVAPSISITSPVHNGTTNGLFYMTGTASDNPGGIGLKSVEVFIRRGSDNYYWNGTSWISTRVGKFATISGSNWTYSGALPGPLTNGVTYYMSAAAADFNNNIASVGGQFHGN